MEVEATLAAAHKKLASVNGEIAAALATRRFRRSAVVEWRGRIAETLKLFDQLEGKQQ